MDADSIIAALNAALPDSGCEPGRSIDEPTVIVPGERLVETCGVLRDAAALGFRVLVEVTAVDWWPAEPRFEVVYHLVAPDAPARLRLKVRVAGAHAHVPTVSTVWPSADWLEREVWDLFGIVFDGHRDLRRLMMPEDWEGHPLRKDYPVQIRMKPRVYEPLQLTEQEFQANIEADRRVRSAPGGDAPGRPDEGGMSRER